MGTSYSTTQDAFGGLLVLPCSSSTFVRNFFQFVDISQFVANKSVTLDLVSCLNLKNITFVGLTNFGNVDKFLPMLNDGILETLKVVYFEPYTIRCDIFINKVVIVLCDFKEENNPTKKETQFLVKRIQDLHKLHPVPFEVDCDLNHLEVNAICVLTGCFTMPHAWETKEESPEDDECQEIE